MCNYNAIFLFFCLHKIQTDPICPCVTASRPSSDRLSSCLFQSFCQFQQLRWWILLYYYHSSSTWPLLVSPSSGWTMDFPFCSIKDQIWGVSLLWCFLPHFWILPLNFKIFFEPRNTPSTDRRYTLFLSASIIIINIKSAPPSPPLFYLI